LSKNKLILITGSNQGNPSWQVLRAKQLISTNIGEIMRSSKLYQTQAWGNEDQDYYINQALLVETLLPPKLCLAKCLEIESQMGRVRIEKWAPRLIDIDIIFYNNLNFTSPKLIIPHPHIQDRNFALVCLNDIIPRFIHPKLKKNVKTLLGNCKDKLEVKEL